MACRFHPDNNYGFDTKEMIKMTNMAKERLQDQLRKNNSVREEERELAAEYVESIPSHLNLHVLGLNYSSTYVEMITKYRSMACRFHPDSNES